MIDEELIRLASSPNQDAPNLRNPFDDRCAFQHESPAQKYKVSGFREQIALLIVIPAFAYSTYAFPIRYPK